MLDFSFNEILVVMFHFIIFVGIGYVIEQIPTLHDGKPTYALLEALGRLYLSIKLSNYAMRHLQLYNSSGINSGIIGAFSLFFLQDKVRSSVRLATTIVA
jgi:hypothetical protein